MNLVAEWVGAVGGWLRKFEDGEEARTDAAATPEESRSSLFRCPECESVYVATDKDACSTCETAVVRVPSTLSETV